MVKPYRGKSTATVSMPTQIDSQSLRRYILRGLPSDEKVFKHLLDRARRLADELCAELDAIQKLYPEGPPKRQLSPEQRKVLSERMRKIWADRKRKLGE